MRKKTLWIILSMIVLIILIYLNPTKNTKKEETRLWPEIEPFHTEYLKVSDIHEIYYELCGNSKGKPLFVLHGGPGGHCSPYMRRFANPEKFLIVLHDQRGAGKSRPKAEIRQNTTQHLVEDIEKLRNRLNLEKIVLFGGSWGSTLALAYAETYPENVCGMILRGVFTATKEEIDHFYHGGVKAFFPELYEKSFASLLETDKRPLPEILLELIKSNDPSLKNKYSDIWMRYEFKISGFEIPDHYIEQEMSHINPETIYTFGLMENYYMTNACFLEEDQLHRDVDKIQHIPSIIVNGRYDMICPPITAYRLHKKLPKSKLIIAEQAGHWMGEKPIEKALIKAINEFE